MSQSSIGYWFLRKSEYESSLEGLAINETDYLAALAEVTRLFPEEFVENAIQVTAAKFGGCFAHFDLVPYPNRRLPYNPVPILLRFGRLYELLYLGLALRDFRRFFNHTDAINKLLSDDVNLYRGALFEIEVGAVLVRAGMRPAYLRNSPDYFIKDLSLGVEATAREVPTDRAIVERLGLSLSAIDFDHLSITLTLKGEQNIDELVQNITEDVQRLVDEKRSDVIRPGWRIRRVDEGGPRSISLRWGKKEFTYEATLAHLVKTILAEKVKKIQRAKFRARCVAALDVRSLLSPLYEPKTDYDHQLYEQNRDYYERQRFLRRRVIEACQLFCAESASIKSVLLWTRRERMPPADEVHRRNFVLLVTPTRVIEVDASNLDTALKDLT